MEFSSLYWLSHRPWTMLILVDLPRVLAVRQQWVQLPGQDCSSCFRVSAFGAESGSLINSNSVSPPKEVEVWDKNRTVSENTNTVLKVPYTGW